METAVSFGSIFEEFAIGWLINVFYGDMMCQVPQTINQSINQSIENVDESATEITLLLRHRLGIGCQRK